MTTVTLDLPRQIYQKAAQIAKATRRPIEQVVVDWIHPPADSALRQGKRRWQGWIR